MDADVKAAVDAAFRDEWGRVVATLIRTTGDWDLAEECAQDAFAMALQRWPADGIPGRPGAWLATEVSASALAKALELALENLQPGDRFHHGFFPTTALPTN